MQRLTLCVIAKDEEAMLGGCLASVRGLVDAIVVVDTGSTDRTVEIAREHGAKVVHHAWSDDFAAARNAALPHVPGGFVLVLDADERLGPGARDAIRKALRRDDFDCGLLPLHDAATLESEPADVVSGRSRRGEPVLLPRLLRRTSDLAWEGLIHEQVTSWALVHRRIVPVRAAIVHYGAVPALREARAKNQRNLALLERRCQREPDDPVPRAYLARELERSGDAERALREAETCWAAVLAIGARGRPRHDVVLPASMLGFLSIRAGAPARALEVIGQARAWSAPHPNLGLLEGWAHEQLALAARDLEGFAAHLAAARRAYDECIALEGESFASECMPGASTFTGRTRLGTVLLLAGELEASERSFRAALAARADHVEARLGLVEALLDSGRPAEALNELQPALQTDLPDAWLLAAAAARALGGNSDACLFLDRARGALEQRAWAAPHREGRRVELETELRPSLVVAAVPSDAPQSLSVVIPAYNRLDLLRPVLEGFAAQAQTQDFELLVVDDGSSPAIAPWFAGLGLPDSFRVLTRERNGGRAAALNTGLAAARGDVIVFCDSDIVPADGFVGDHARFHREHGDVRATCLGALDWGVDAGLWGAWTGARSNPRLRRPGGDVGWTQWFTDNWSFRRELFTAHGLRFDEAFRAWGWEELELARRLAALGARNTHVDGARGLHLKPATPEGLRGSFARSVPNLARLAELAPDAPEVRDWMSVRASAAALADCDALFDLLWARAQAHEQAGIALRDVSEPLIDWLSVALSDLVFRLGIARGFVELGEASTPRGATADVALAAATGAAAARLAALERALGLHADAQQTLALAIARLAQGAAAGPVRACIERELRRAPRAVAQR